MVLRFLLLLALTGPLWAQPQGNPQMGQLRDLIHNTIAQAPPLDQERQPVIARLELLTVQADQLSKGGGDWNVFFRFYQETQIVISRSGALPGTLASNWTQIQSLVSDIARQQGRSIGIVGLAYSPGQTQAVPNLAVQRAAQLAQQLEASLGPEPAGADTRYRQARSALSSLRKHLQSGKSLEQIVHDRRFFQVVRSALELPQGRFAELDQALDQLPDD
ncbi:hypothetical protein JST97_31765 [bacterium]|nr:hypothetical protein [bacterium]